MSDPRDIRVSGLAPRVGDLTSRQKGILNTFTAFTELSGGTLALLIGCLVVALGFEFVNGFHDTANAVATVIYTKTLKPCSIRISMSSAFAG